MSQARLPQIDPRLVPVTRVDTDMQAVDLAQLSPEALRARFAQPPQWQPEVIAEKKGLPMCFNILKKRSRKKRRYLLLVMQQQLEGMKADYERFGLLYLTLVKIQHAVAGDNRWIEGEKQKAANKLARCNLAQQQELAEKIYLLQSEENFLNQYRMKNQIQPMNNQFHNN